MVRVATGLLLTTVAALAITVLFGATFADLHRPQETLDSFGGEVFREAYYLGPSHHLYRKYDVKKRWGTEELYQATQKEEVQVLERQVDKDGDRLYFKAKTASGVVGLVGYLLKEKVPHVVLASRLSPPAALTSQLGAVPAALVASFDPAFRHTRVYTLMTLFDTDAWRFWALAGLFCLLSCGLGLLLPPIAVRLGEIVRERSVANRTLRLGFSYGAVIGILCFWNTQNIAAYWGTGGKALLYPAGQSLGVWAIWVVSVIAVLTVPVMWLSVEPFLKSYLLFVVLALGASVVTGLLVCHASLAGVAWAFGQVVSLLGKALSSLAPLLLVFALLYGFFFGTAGSASSGAGLFSGGGSSEGESAHDANERRRREQEASDRREEQRAKEALEAEKQRAYAEKEWDRWKS